MSESIWVEVKGGITAPQGFKAAGVYCGIRKEKKDLALITSDVPASVAAVFTLNKTVAAPVLVDKILLKRGNRECTAIIANSGNANACTGERGLNDAWKMVESVANALSIPQEQVLVASTGVIGQYLPIEKLEAGIAEIASQLAVNGNEDAAKAIMTTDTFSKEVAVCFELFGKKVTIGSMAKGSGMIAPNMATMLAFLTTDAQISSTLLQKTFGKLVEVSFNRVSVDGDMSTNDMAVILANGKSGAQEIFESTPEYSLFASALEFVLVKLAKLIARDGEGATKLIEVIVQGAESDQNAVAAARSVANSNLVKTAIHGEDANWGRILAALGYAGIPLDPDQIELSINDLPILGKNYEIKIDEDAAKLELMKDTITILIDLNQGTGQATFWTCDLTKEYIHINASYRS
ncbi:MAG: bifunctional glutamate N-acetyltransferase/amino-acid acetyltransferase ArgJ [Candidatus Kapaibacterium sp.]|jgi:glutamate N-acetyltransferase/amino-acid N-acetyltransferase